MRNLAAVLSLGSALIALGVYVTGRSAPRPQTLGERVRNFFGGALQMGGGVVRTLSGAKRLRVFG